MLRRSLARRLRNVRIGAWEPMADFDWTWPRKADRAAIHGKTMTSETWGCPAAR